MKHVMSLSVAAACVSMVGCESQTSKNTPPAQPEVAAAQHKAAQVSFQLASVGLPTEGMWKCDPAFRDVNADGHLDLLAIPRLGHGPRVWLGDGRGEWTEAFNGLVLQDNSCGGGIEAADVNGDGHADLVVADHCNGVYVYLGDGLGNWDQVVAQMHPEDMTLELQDYKKRIWMGAEDLAVGDIDGDGDIDIVAGSSDEGGINCYINDGSGLNWERVSRGLPADKTWANRVILHDMNGDGVLDLVASHSEGLRVWLNDGEGYWEPASRGLPTPMLGGLFHGLDVGDVNNDRRPDIAVANWIDGPEVFLQAEDGTWEAADNVFEEMNGGAQGLALGDLNNDGNLDLIVTGRLEIESGYIRGVYALLGDGSGRNWEFQRDCGLPERGLSGMAGVGFGDVNGDGLFDFAVGTGLMVEQSTDPPKPVLEEKLIVWTTSRNQRTETTTAAKTE